MNPLSGCFLQVLIRLFAAIGRWPVCINIPPSWIMASAKMMHCLFCDASIEKKQICRGALAKAKGVGATAPDSFSMPMNGSERGLDAANENIAVSAAPLVAVGRPIGVNRQSSQAAIKSFRVASTMTACRLFEPGVLATDVSEVRSASAQSMGSRFLALAVHTSFLAFKSRDAANTAVRALWVCSLAMPERPLHYVGKGSSLHEVTAFQRCAKHATAIHMIFNKLNSSKAAALGYKSPRKSLFNIISIPDYWILEEVFTNVVGAIVGVAPLNFDSIGRTEKCYTSLLKVRRRPGQT